MAEDKYITIDKMVESIGVSLDIIKEHLERLKRDAVIKRVGSTKSGHWEVLDDK